MLTPRSLARAALTVLALPMAVGLAACAPAEEKQTATEADSCATEELAVLEPGTLTIATDSPAYEPWFVDDDPTNGEGFESAVAYAVAEQLGFAAEDVAWVTVPFNNSYAPGQKKFDFDINQISVTPERQAVVDFSDGYYSAAQAVITLEKDGVEASSVEDLAGLKLGAQTGTTSLTAVRDVIQPAEDPAVFKDTNAAKQALLNGQVDAIVADLPTAFYITAAEIKGSTILGQFQPEAGQTEEFGLLMEKGSELLPCVNEALAELEDEGVLAELEQQWLSDTVDVPVLD